MAKVVDNENDYIADENKNKLKIYLFEFNLKKNDIIFLFAIL